MKLRYKLLAPFGIVLSCLIVVIHFYWLPQYRAYSESLSRQSEQKYLELLAMALAPDLLSGDLAQAHKTLDVILADRHEWRKLLVVDNHARRIYPLSEVNFESADDINIFTQEIINDGKSIGTIKAAGDIDALVERRMRKIWILELFFVFILIAASHFGILVQFFWIQRPLKKLAAGAARISEGDYKVILPQITNDEIGRLVSAFANMKDKLQLREKQLTSDRLRVKAILDNAGEGIFTMDAHGEILAINKAATSIIGYESEELIGLNVLLITPESVRSQHREQLRELAENRDRDLLKAGMEVCALSKSRETVPIWLSITEIELAEGRIYVGAMTDLRVLKQTENELRRHRDNLEELVEERTADLKKAKERSDNLVIELEKALEEVKTLQGFLPICSHCKKIRDDQGYWNQVEEYISSHSGAQFSHGICPDCLRELYPKVANRVLSKLKRKH